MNKTNATPRPHARVLAGIALLVAAATVHADVWDEQTANDDTAATRQELVHGSNEQHDLSARRAGGSTAPDEDWFRITQKARASYEIVVERASGDACPVGLARIGADAATVLQESLPVGLGCTRSLRWTNGANTVSGQYVRVDSESCASSGTCDADDIYRLRAYETTYAVPRFNNTGTQVSVLMIQNTSDARVTGTVHFWRVDGSLAASQAFALNARASLVLNTATVVPALAGSITVANDGRYGALSGKIVGLEPATGFSFDTPMEPRPL